MPWNLLNRAVIIWATITVIYPILALISIFIAVAFFGAGILGGVFAAALALIPAVIFAKTARVTGIEVDSGS